MELRFRGPRGRGHGIHGTQIHLETRRGEQGQKTQHADAGPKSFHAQPSGKPRQHALQHRRLRLAGRRKGGNQERHDQVNKKKGAADPQGGKFPDFAQHRKTAEGQGQECAHRRQGRNQAHGADFPGRILAPGGAGPVQKQQVGNPVIHCNGDDGATEAQRQDGQSGLQERHDKQGHRSSGQCRHKCQQADPRPRKGQQKQQGNAGHGKNDHFARVAPGHRLVVQGRPVGAHRGHDHLVSRRVGALAAQPALQVVKKGPQLPGHGRIRRRPGRRGDHQHVRRVGGKHVPLERTDAGRRRKTRQLGEKQVAQRQRIEGHKFGLADALQGRQLGQTVGQARLDPGVGQERRHVTRQVGFRKQKRQMGHQMVDQDRHLVPHGLHADPFEQTAGRHGRRHLTGHLGQRDRPAGLQVEIDGNQVLARMMAQDIAGGRNHRIALGQGGHDVRVKGDAVYAHPGHQGQHDDG